MDRKSEIPLRDQTDNAATRSHDRKVHHKKSTLKKIGIYFRDYCDNSSIIGFKFLGERRSVGERLLWFILIVIAIALSVYYILEIYYKYEENPFLVNLATRQSPIFTIPFPAVTICPVVKTEKESFNFTRAVNKIWNNETLTEEEMTNTQYMSLLCEDMDDSYKQGLFPNKTFTEDFYDQIDYLRPTAESTFFFCTFMDESEECSDLFVPIVLDDGICYTFNILDRQEIYKDDVMHYNNHHRNKNVSSWTIDGGYAKGSGRKTYPRRALLAGADNALQVFLMQNVIDKDQLCTRDSQGYTVVFHTPHIIPQLRRNYIMIPLDTSVQVNVQPQLMTTSKEVKGYRPVVRQCYFTDERPLKFFRIYNPENCNLECLTNYTLNKCGCVGFYMPRNNNTAICGNGMTECMERAIYEMKERELEMFLEDSQEKDATCNCMPLCNELTYQTETARLYFPWREKFTAEKHFSTLLDYKGLNISEIHMSAVSIFFKQDYFQTSQRTELYGPFDFLANFGGLLGLFTGFSLLSAVEIIYYISVRLWCNKRLYNDFSGPQNEA